MSGLRQRRKEVSQVVTEFDAFPKVPETYVEQTTAGGSGGCGDNRRVHINDKFIREIPTVMK